MESALLKNSNRLLIVFFCLLYSCTSAVDNSSKNVHSIINASLFAKKIEQEAEIQLIDVRTAAEFNAGAINKAINYDLLDGTFEKNINKLDAKKPVYIYCAKGGRSGKASQLLKEKGFLKIYDLKGGYSSWTNSEKE